MIPSIVTTAAFLLFSKIIFELVQFWIAPYLSPLRKIPGPPAKNWYYGWTTPDVIVDLSVRIAKKHDEYGRVFYGTGVHRAQNLYIADELAVNYVFQNQFSSSGPELFRRFPFISHVIRIFFGSTILGVEEDVHKRQRRAMLPAFTDSAIRQASSVMYEVTQDLMDLMRKNLVGNSDLTQIDATSYIQDASLDMIGKAGFGHDLGALNKKTTDFNERFFDLVSMITSPSYHALLRFRFPWIRYLGNFFSIEEGKLNTYRKENNVYADDLVKTAKQEAEKESAGEDRNFLRLIKRTCAESDSNRITDEELRESVSVLLLAGFETTATTITWAIHVLTRDAGGLKKQSRLREELNADEFQGWQDDFDVLDGMPYLDAVCTEVLRLYPALGVVGRICWQDTVIPVSVPITLRDGTTTNRIPIKKGEYIYISTGSLNRNVSIWGQEANEFIPERWLRDDHIYFDANLSTNNSSLGGWNHLSTFGQGMRMCLGFRFALAEFKIILAYFITNFDWKQGIDPNTGKPFEIQPRGQTFNKVAIKGAANDQFSLPVLVREIK